MGRPKNPFRKCSKCRIEIPLERKSSYCEVCHNIMSRYTSYVNKSSLINTPQNEKMKNHLIEFVDRLRARKDMASMEEIFLEMITLNNHFVKDRESSREETAQTQIIRMWKNLQAIRDAIREKNKETNG